MDDTLKDIAYTPASRRTRWQKRLVNNAVTKATKVYAKRWVEENPEATHAELKEALNEFREKEQDRYLLGFHNSLAKAMRRVKL